MAVEFEWMLYSTQAAGFFTARDQPPAPATFAKRHLLTVLLCRLGRATHPTVLARHCDAPPPVLRALSLIDRRRLGKHQFLEIAKAVDILGSLNRRRARRAYIFSSHIIFSF